jgi:aryl-alcohol dehydrogenase-like predicted oxidoreductase
MGYRRLGASGFSVPVLSFGTGAFGVKAISSEHGDRPMWPRRAGKIRYARNEDQLRQTLGAVGWSLTQEQIARLDAASDRPRAYPYWRRLG